MVSKWDNIKMNGKYLFILKKEIIQRPRIDVKGNKKWYKDDKLHREMILLLGTDETFENDLTILYEKMKSKSIVLEASKVMNWPEVQQIENHLNDSPAKSPRY